jgi:hypothetical protein
MNNDSPFDTLTSQIVRLVRIAAPPSHTQHILNLRDRLISQPSNDTPSVSSSFRKQISSLAHIAPLSEPPAHLAPALINRLTSRIAELIVQETISELVAEFDAFADELVEEELDVDTS